MGAVSVSDSRPECVNDDAAAGAAAAAGACGAVRPWDRVTASCAHCGGLWGCRGCGPRVRRDHPLNLSISISGGEETN